MSYIKRIDPKEFAEFGYLQEVNRQFLHPLGMALEIMIDNDGNYSFAGVWDLRNEPDGMAFAENTIEKDKIDRVKSEWDKKSKKRLENLSYVIQPPDDMPRQVDHLKLDCFNT